jgi:Cu(I)/Ag(I) efflux system membrane protein CusA/SilA
VSTIVAGLLPIMWSTRAGAEVMKPLATPVLGGMVSSLLHVLLVTPVIFCWLRERQLAIQPEEPSESRGGAWTPAIAALGLIAVVGVAALGWRALHSRDGRAEADGLVTIQEVRAGDLQILIRSRSGALRRGRNAYTIEFRSRDGTLVDAGAVRASASMSMPGMAMSGGVVLSRSSVVGRYEATAEFAMAGAWRMSLEWEGPSGRESVNFEGSVQ